jgi:hypothetical protein
MKKGTKIGPSKTHTAVATRPYASGNSGAVGFTAGLRETGVAVRALRGSGDDAKSNGRAEDLEVVMVDLVFQSSLTDLVQAVKLVKIHGVTVRHNQPMEYHRQPALAETLHFAGFAQSKGSFGNQDMLAVMRIDRVCHHDLYRPGEIAIKAIDQRGLKLSSLKQNVRLTLSGVHVHACMAFLNGLVTGRGCGRRIGGIARNALRPDRRNASLLRR